MADKAHKDTDNIIEQLDKKLELVYSQANIEMQQKLDSYLQKSEAKDKIKLQDLKSGKITKKEYTQWKTGQVKIGQRWQELKDTLANDMTNTNEIATALINGHKPGVYALNHTYATFQVEKDSLTDTSYSLYSHEAVENLIKNEPNLLPKNKVDIPKDKAWNKKKIDNAITQGILQGESLKDVSGRLKNVTDMNQNAAMRNARTAMTSAQNVGRIDAYKRAKNLGINMKKVWLATLDGRTRHSHRMLDGQKVDIDEKFSNGLMFPGDPDGMGTEVYNCRCTLLSQPTGVDYKVSDLTKRNDKLDGMSYESWKNYHSFGLANGIMPDANITNVWSNTKMSNVYNLIHDQNVTDGNKFYSELGKIGKPEGLKPSEVWEKYLNGELDADDVAKFEDILMKYLPDSTVDKIEDIADAMSHDDFLKSIKDISIWSDQVPSEAFGYMHQKVGNDSLAKFWDDYKAGKISDSKLDELLGFKGVNKIEDIASASNPYAGFKVLTGDESDIFLKQYHNKNIIGKKGHNTMDGKTASEINNALREGKEITNTDYLTLMKKLDEGIDSNSIPEDMVFYRGISDKALKASGDFADFPVNGTIDEQLEWAKTKIGKNISDKGYLQVSASTERSYTQFEDVGLMIKTKKGTHAYISDYLEESEVIFAKDSKLKIVDAQIEIAKTQYGDAIPKLRLICEFDDISDAAKAVDKVDDISDAAKEAEKKLKIPKGNPMTKEQADNYKVNVFYDKSEATLTNCQTTTFAYECRCQGYDVVAIPKDKSLKEIFDLQDDLANDPSKAWINKTTGKPPKHELEWWNAGKDSPTNAEMIKAIDDAVGHNGERYAISLVNNSGKSAHIINIDRDENGFLRIVDNQRGPLEKNTWVGNFDVENYLQNFKTINYLVRQDDCVPNPEYFNKILTSAAKAKPDLPASASSFADYSKLNKFVKDNNLGKTSEYYKKWKYGIVEDDKLDDLLGFKKSVDKVEDVVEPKVKVPKNLISMDNKTLDEVSNIIKQKTKGTYGAYYQDWLDGKVKDADLDELLLGIKKPTSKVDDLVDLDKLKNKKVSNIHNELIETGEHGKFWKMMGEIGKPYDKKQSATWEMYLKGQLKEDEKKKIDDFLLKNYFNKSDDAIKTATIKSDDLIKAEKKLNDLQDKLQKYEWYNNKIDIQGEVLEFTKDGKKVYAYSIDKGNDLLKQGAIPSNKFTEDFAKSLKGVKQDDLLNDIDDIKKKIVDLSSNKSDELVKAEEKLKKAQDALSKQPNKTYSGIWKDDVTLADYENKKNVIKGKKEYYYSQIEELEHCIDDPDSWQYKKYGGETGLNKKIAEFEKYLDDLDDFETEGKKYAKLQKEVTKAQQEVIKNTPVGEAFSQARKDAAVWGKNKTDDYKRVDKIFDPHAREVHATRTAKETSAYMDYTSASGPYNKPLVGFDSPDGTGKEGWTEKYWVGSGKVDIDKRGRGDKIRALTTLVEKSTYDFDFWMQSSQDFATLEGKEGFLGIPYGTLQNMKDSDFQKFIGTTAELPQFISGAVNKGGGTYNPGDMRLNIYVPNGSEALYVLEDGTFSKHEHEMILQRGGTYRIMNMYWGKDEINGGRKLFVDMELHPEMGYDKFQQTKSK